MQIVFQGGLMTNSRQLAHTWPYLRRNRFVERMKLTSERWFRDQSCELHPKYKYCLAEWKDWPKNIILPEVAKYVEEKRQECLAADKAFALHDYVHHGLSSQALLFNLIGPLIVRGDLEPLKTALRSRGLTWPGSGTQVVLEYEDRKVFNEDSGQPTSIDLVVGNPQESGALFIECKFTENGFGGCSVFGQGDCEGANPVRDLSRCYLHHIGRKYWELLQKYRFVKGALSIDSTCILANHYQFFREVLFALEKKGTFVLLSDDRSPTFSGGGRGLMPFLLSFLPEEYVSQVGQASIQDVVKAIETSGRHDDWVGKFKSKYGIDEKEENQFTNE
jgi:POLQ-like helicase